MGGGVHARKKGRGVERREGGKERGEKERKREREMAMHIIISYMTLYLQVTDGGIPYSRKYWRELNLVVDPKIAIVRILADLNLAVRYRIAIRILYPGMRVGNFGGF